MSLRMSLRDGGIGRADRGQGEREQAGLILGEHPAGDQALELGAQALGVVGGGAHAENAADVLGA